jgi:uncharacterized membrane protein YhaH (DUF805 family)
MIGPFQTKEGRMESPFYWMMQPLKKFADFSGRARRMEYWMYFVGYMGAVIVASILDGILGMSGMIGGVYGPLSMIVMLGSIIPSIACGVRRLHDRDMSGWWYLVVFTGIGAIVLLVFFLLEGTQGPNRFGPDPKGGTGTPQSI